MANSAQAKFAMYSTILDEEEKRRKEQEDYIEQETKRANKASFWSLMAGLGTAIATGGTSIPIWATMGLSAGASKLGSEVGEAFGGKRMKLDEGKYLFGITGEGGIRQENKTREALRKEFNKGQNVAAIQSGVTAGLLKGLLPSGFGGANVGAEANPALQNTSAFNLDAIPNTLEAGAPQQALFSSGTSGQGFGQARTALGAGGNIVPQQTMQAFAPTEIAKQGMFESAGGLNKYLEKLFANNAQQNLLARFGIGK